VMEKDSGKY